MGWSDILGAVGSVAGIAGDLFGGETGWLGTAGKIASGISGVANLGGQFITSGKSQDLQDTATQGVTQGLSASLALAREDAKRQKDAFDKAMGLIPQQTEAYKKMLETLGPMPDMPVFDPNNIEVRAGQLLPEYMSETDHAMERMFGNDMGSMMAHGVDNSTGGIQARAALGDKSAELHRTAYNRAYSDALTYATGIYDEQIKSHAGMTADRAAALKEAMSPYDTAFADYAGLYGKSGADNSLSTAGNLADMLSKWAAVGTQSAATGASTSATKQSFSDLISGVKDIWGGTGAAGGGTTTDPFAYIGSGGTSTYTLASGRDY